MSSKRTFPSWSPKVQIDYVISQKVASEDVLDIDIAPSGISDHLPIVVELVQ
jgi:endonuclease/exonuclease/phosphatase family metal-dependent hydrolase